MGQAHTFRRPLQSPSHHSYNHRATLRLLRLDVAPIWSVCCDLLPSTARPPSDAVIGAATGTLGAPRAALVLVALKAEAEDEADAGGMAGVEAGAEAGVGTELACLDDGRQGGGDKRGRRVVHVRDLFSSSTKRALIAPGKGTAKFCNIAIRSVFSDSTNHSGELSTTSIKGFLHIVQARTVIQ